MPRFEVGAEASESIASHNATVGRRAPTSAPTNGQGAPHCRVTITVPTNDGSRRALCAMPYGPDGSVLPAVMRLRSRDKLCWAVFKFVPLPEELARILLRLTLVQS